LYKILNWLLKYFLNNNWSNFVRQNELIKNCSVAKNTKFEIRVLLFSQSVIHDTLYFVVKYFSFIKILQLYGTFNAMRVL